jgi:hypothetical protein
LSGEERNKGHFQPKGLEGGFWEVQGSANAIWDKMAEGIMKVAREALGEST